MLTNEKTLKAAASRLGRALATSVLFVAVLALGACDPGPAHDDGDGIGTSPSGPSVKDQPAPRMGGLDTSACPAGTVIVVGTSDSDVLEGTSASECFVAGGGNDLIVTGGGNDFVLAGEGDDYVISSPGAQVRDAEEIELDSSLSAK